MLFPAHCVYLRDNLSLNKLFAFYFCFFGISLVGLACAIFQFEHTLDNYLRQNANNRTKRKINNNNAVALAPTYIKRAMKTSKNCNFKLNFFVFRKISIRNLKMYTEILSIRIKVCARIRNEQFRC